VAASATFTPISWPTASPYYYAFGWSNYSSAVYVSSPSDPLVEVNTPASWGWPAGNVSVHLASGITGAPGTDGEILVIDGTTVYNWWVFSRTSDTSATASAFAQTDVIAASGWGSSSPFLGAGVLGAGSSELAGLLVQAETDAGEIQHALQFEVGGNLNHSGYTGDAISGDGPSSTGPIEEGDRVAIPAGTAMPTGLSPLGQKVFRALQQYGAFDIDTTDCCSMAFRVQQNGYDQTTIDALNNDAQPLITLLQKVN
jgi:hypothetical protein